MKTLRTTISGVFFSLLLCGCDPFSNAEQRFPLPGKLWDRAEKAQNCRAFVFRGVSETEFLEIKAALLLNDFSESGRDFFFLPVNGKNPAKINSSDAVLLIRHEADSRDGTSAAAYIKREHILMIGQGCSEP